MALLLDRPATKWESRTGPWCLDIVLGNTVVRTVDNFLNRDAVLEEINRFQSRPRGQGRGHLAPTRVHAGPT
jgi:hypothetical protein